MKKFVPGFISLMLLFGMVASPAVAQTPETDPRTEGLGELQPLEAEVLEDLSEEARYIVLLEGDSLVSYEGDIPGLRAANVRQPGEKLDVATEASVMYLDYLRNKQDGQIDTIQSVLKRDLDIDYRYDVILNGFAARMSAGEAKSLAKVDGVRAVYKEQLWQINTDVSPTFLGADTLWVESETTPGVLETKGEGMLIGVLDTGINMDHPSFADIGGDGYDHVNPFGEGVYKGLCASDPSNFICNDKLVGVWAYTQSYEPDLYGEDGHSHGSHTASTAAGNYLELDFNGIPVTISGMAPHANIIAYDVCYADGCPTAGSVDAVEQAIVDGVDVLNYSIGPSSGAINPYDNEVELAMLEAIGAGILTSTSAGNEGPDASTVYKAPAWDLVVANSTHGRIFGFPLEVHEPAGEVLYDAVALPGTGLPFSADLMDYPIRWAGDDGNAIGCTANGAFTPGFFDGAIALISRGTCGFAEKITNATAAGAVGVLVYNNSGGPAIVMGACEATTVPSAMLDKEDGEAIVTLMSATLQVNVYKDQVAGFKTIWADILNSGSSRGPFELLDILVPNVSAPGTNVLAAYATPGATAPYGGVGTDAEIDLMSGTSMASPHGAGAALLLMDLFPSWTTQEIKSAIIMSAYDAATVKDDGITPTDPFDDGNGRIDLTKAALIGLVMDETITNFENANPTEGGDVKTLNIPSYQNDQCVGECSFSRTVKNVADVETDYTVVVDAPADVVITPTPASFTLAAGATQEITFDIDVSAAEMGTWQFAFVTFDTEDTFSTLEPITDARFPLAILPDAGNLPGLVEQEVYRDAGGVLLEDLYSIEITDLTIETAGLTEAELFEFQLAGDPNNDDAFDELGDVWYTTFPIVPGTKRVVMEILETSASDLDLFFGFGPTPSEATLWDVSATPAAMEYLSWVDPIPYNWWVLVQNWGGDPEVLDDITLAVALVPNVESTNFEVTGPTSNPALETFELEVTWDVPEMEALSAWYGWFSLGSDAANAGNIGETELNVYRPYDDVTKSVSSDTAMIGDTLTYAITIEPNQASEDMYYEIQDVLPDGVSYVADSVATSGSDVQATYDEVNNSINWAGTMPKIEYGYNVTTMTTDPYCQTPWHGGGYDDLKQYGLTPLDGLEGDGFTWSFTTLGIGQEYYGEVIPTKPTFTDDGYLYMTPLDDWWYWVNQNFPDPSMPNGIVAPWMRDMEIVYEADTKGVMGGSLGPVWVVQFDDIYDWYSLNEEEDAPADVYMDFQVWSWLAIDDSPWPEIVIAYDNVMGDWEWVGGPWGTIGLENKDGTYGTTFAYDSYTPQTGDVICFNYVDVGSEPVVITFDVLVETDAEIELTNTAMHVADGLGMQEEETLPASTLLNAALAVDDAYWTDFETVLDVPAPGVMENDRSANADEYAFVELKDAPAHGEVVLNLDGSFVYTPDDGFRGDDTFTYTLFNTPTGRSVFFDDATVTITVNDKPVAYDDTYTTDEDTPLDITLTADYLLPGPEVWTVETDPAHGTLTGTAPDLVYTPDLDWYGTDSFTFSVNDGIHDSNIATITIDVLPVNDGPVAVDDAYEADQDTLLVVDAPGVLANDTDPDPTDSLYADIKEEPLHGTLMLNVDGSFTYMPDAGFYGEDSFTYYLLGIPTRDFVDWATVTITVKPGFMYYLPLIFN